MPAIKKKWIKANQEMKDTENADNNDEAAGDEDRELAGGDTPAKGKSSSSSKPKKRHIDPSQGGMLRGLDGEVLLEKRKRFVPPAEAKLGEWLDSNLEKRNDVKLSLVQLYKYYTELCQGDGSGIVDIPAFNRMIKNKFGKTVGIKESSVYKTIVKERNLNEKKKPGGGLKLKEIAHEAINHFGNPWNGVRFFALKQYVGTKYPFLKIDQRPKILKRILEMGVGYGQIELVKGIGMAGFYRLPGATPPPPKVKDEVKEEGKSEEADGAGSDAQEPKGKDDAAKTDEKTEAGTKGEDADKQKGPKPKKLEKCNLMRIAHADPKKIEDTFPMAITFQSAPKTANIVKIRRYIQEQYKLTIGDSRWRKAVEGGAEEGHWEYITGSGISGKLHLLMDDFDPDCKLYRALSVSSN
ncbi:heterochromatin protein 1-binding protein 3-like [Plakobranchus ocellatus]|uniref:Heterochromatin protein 1-binding protein 3-like n=1 Tax=Plakobranchus ocellatus TaxID=259542 RepID=A0AAV3YBS6_9GAST|nr:heterochromatin protein 1-binding protein 3-like [Plakobranchus ocellatus]